MHALLSGGKLHDGQLYACRPIATVAGVLAVP